MSMNGESGYDPLLLLDYPEVGPIPPYIPDTVHHHFTSTLNPLVVSRADLCLAQGNFVASTPVRTLSTHSVTSLTINDNGTVRDDKLNIIRIEFSDPNFLIPLTISFRKSFLFTPDVNQRMLDYLSNYAPNQLFVFFTLKPQIGEFKKEIQAEDLVQIQSIDKEESAIVLKAVFTRTLRPAHSLQKAFQKKKKNWMNLHVTLFFKSPMDPSFSSVTAVESFRFRSNSGKSARVYSAKAQEQESDTDRSRPKEESVGATPPPSPYSNISSTQTMGSVGTAPPMSTGHILPGGVPQPYGRPQLLFPSIAMIPTQTVPTLHMGPTGLTSTVPITLAPTIHRIHPNRCFAFQNWETDNPDITILLVGKNLENISIRAEFVHPLRGSICPAAVKDALYGEKEFYVPCLKRLLLDDIVALSDEGLTVDVIFRGANGEFIPHTQKYTYQNLRPTAQLALFGLQLGNHGSADVPNGQENSGTVGNGAGTPLELPDRVGEEDIMSFFDVHGINLSLVDRYRRSVLHYAVRAGTRRVLQQVLDQGCHVNQRDVYGCTPLHLAVFGGRFDIAQDLLSAGASYTIPDGNGDTPLTLAIKWREYGVLQVFMKNMLGTLKTLKDNLSQHQLNSTVKWLKDLDGVCKITWRLCAIPFLPPVTRAICTAAVVENPPFVTYDDNSGTYTMDISDAASMINALFPKAQTVAPMETDNDTVTVTMDKPTPTPTVLPTLSVDPSIFKIQTRAMSTTSTTSTTTASSTNLGAPKPIFAGAPSAPTRARVGPVRATSMTTTPHSHQFTSPFVFSSTNTVPTPTTPPISEDHHLAPIRATPGISNDADDFESDSDITEGEEGDTGSDMDVTTDGYDAKPRQRNSRTRGTKFVPVRAGRGSGDSTEQRKKRERSNILDKRKSKRPKSESSTFVPKSSEKAEFSSSHMRPDGTYGEESFGNINRTLDEMLQALNLRQQNIPDLISREKITYYKHYISHLQSLADMNVADLQKKLVILESSLNSIDTQK